LNFKTESHEFLNCGLATPLSSVQRGISRRPFCGKIGLYHPRGLLGLTHKCRLFNGVICGVIYDAFKLRLDFQRNCIQNILLTTPIEKFENFEVR